MTDSDDTPSPEGGREGTWSVGHSPTITYATWLTVDGEFDRVEDTIEYILDSRSREYNLEGVVAGYRAAINDALPEGVQLVGNTFYGPALEADLDLTGYPVNEDGDLDLEEILAGIAFAPILERHEITANRRGRPRAARRAL